MATIETAGPRSRGSPGLADVAVLGLLLAYSVGRVASSWRYLDRFMGDDGWVLRVAQRIAEGEVLYRDMAWDYGPLPVYPLGLLFRISPDVVWFHILDILLCATAIGALWITCRGMAGLRTCVLVTLWAGILGSSGGLISHQLDAYTTAVAWGTSASLATLACACIWAMKRAGVALLAACTFAILAVLSKPEYGLAALCTLGVALWVQRPSRWFGILVLATTIGTPGLVFMLTEPTTRAAIWRGYSGYDLIAVGSVPVFEARNLFGALIVSAVVGVVLWFATRIRSVAAVAALSLAVLAAVWVTEGTGFFHATGIAARLSWTGLVPALVGMGWIARRARMPAGFWVVWIYALAVTPRAFLVGRLSEAAVGPAVLAFCLLVHNRVVPRPTAAGWIALTIFFLFSSVAPELRSLRKPSDLRPVSTTLGVVRTPARTARTIESVNAALETLPPGSLFVSGWGPAWYLTSGRSNPTRFDGVFHGIGTTEPELTELLEDLRENPPAAVLLQSDPSMPATVSPHRIWRAVGQPDSLVFRSADRRWALHAVAPR